MHLMVRQETFHFDDLIGAPSMGIRKAVSFHRFRRRYCIAATIVSESQRASIGLPSGFSLFFFGDHLVFLD